MLSGVGVSLCVGDEGCKLTALILSVIKRGESANMLVIWLSSRLTSHVGQHLRNGIQHNEKNEEATTEHAERAPGDHR